MRTWRGPIMLQNTETGDGRVMAPGAITWAGLPLPFAWLRDGDQHVSLTEVAPQVGTIDTLEWDGDQLMGSGRLDDEQPDGAELARRMDAGAAGFGPEQGVSVDLDDVAYQLLFQPEDTLDEVVILASATADRMNLRLGDTSWRAGLGAVLTAAAGDPDPGDPDADGVLADGSQVMFEDSADAMRYRFTRGRIRGVTACAVPAFDGARVALDAPGSGDATAEPAPADATTVAVVASAGGPLTPPADWFFLPEPEPGMTGTDVYGMPAQELLVEQPNGSLGVPLTITDDGRVFGHIALWGQCHVGYEGQCITAPSSPTSYAHFHTGAVRTDTGLVPTGRLTVGCDHAGDGLFAAEARDHYAHAGLGWADVRATDGALGIWCSGALSPDVTATQLRLLQSLALSGDWRRIGGALELIGVLAVNYPGFGVAREAITAAALPQLAEAAPAPTVGLRDGELQSLVASGIVSRCPDCQRRASVVASAQASPELAELLALQREANTMLRSLDARTRHFIPAAGAALVAELAAPEPATPPQRPRGFVAAPRV